MAMTEAYLNLTANAGGTAVTHIGLIDSVTGVEVTGGTPAYARQPVTWVAAAAGLIRPDANLVFDIPSGATVAEWRGFSQLALGGTNYGGQNLTSQPFASQGTYTLLAASTAVDHDAV